MSNTLTITAHHSALTEAIEAQPFWGNDQRLVLHAAETQHGLILGHVVRMDDGEGRGFAVGAIHCDPDSMGPATLTLSNGWVPAHILANIVSMVMSR